MTVAELIEALKVLDPALEVKFSDFEQGHSEINDVMVTNGWDSFGSYLNNGNQRTREQFDALPLYVVLS